MTAEELEVILQGINSQSLSDEELQKLQSVLSLKLAEVDWFMRCRKCHKQHFPCENK